MAKPLKIRKITPGARVEKAARRILRTRIKEFYSCWPDPNHTPTLEELHNLRISGKRLRYTAESLRDLYPDRLALLIELLKLNQDLLGEIQDCVTQRGLIEGYIARLRRRSPQKDQIAALEKIVSEYEWRQSTLFAQFHETWRGMAMDEFRASLRAMVSRVKKTKESFSVDQTDDEGLAQGRPSQRTGAEIFPVDQAGDDGFLQYRARELAAAESFSVDQAGDEARAEAVVDVDDGDVRCAGVEHSE